jgi:hypothetical protein
MFLFSPPPLSVIPIVATSLVTIWEKQRFSHALRCPAFRQAIASVAFFPKNGHSTDLHVLKIKCWSWQRENARFESAMAFWCETLIKMLSELHEAAPFRLDDGLSQRLVQPTQRSRKRTTATASCGPCSSICCVLLHATLMPQSNSQQRLCDKLQTFKVTLLFCA